MAPRSLTPSLKQTGFSLIEILLVLTIFAVISMIGINRWHQYREKMQTEAIKNDLTQIAQALDQYFYIQGCDSSGNFKGQPNPSMTDLGLTITSRPPIAAYEAYIVNSEIEAAGKPIYLLKIVATLDVTLSATQMYWYGQLFNAGKIDLDHAELIWQTTPNNRASTSNAYWVLEGQRAIFRRIQNGLTSSLGYSYCAQ